MTPFTNHQLAAAAWSAYREASEALNGSTRALESASAYGGDPGWTDPLELLYDGSYTGQLPLIPRPFPPVMYRDKRRGEDIPVYLNEQSLAIIRDRLRYVCSVSEYAQSALENRVNYTLGTGLVYRVEADHPNVPKDQVKNAQRLLDLFGECNALELREAEGLIRRDVEGESFVRLFAQRDGMPLLRFVEPDFVRSPDGGANKEDSFGIHTPGGDVENIQGYWISEDLGSPPVLTPALEVVHIKANNYLNSKRGRPIFYPVEQNLKRVEQMMSAVSSMARARAKIALIRKLKGIAPASASSLREQVTATKTRDPITGEERYIEQFRDGTILTSNDRVDYELPSFNVSSQEFLSIMYADLKGVAARLVMPEWMLTSNTEDMAAYTASLVAEAPSTKMFQRLQREARGHWGEYRIGTRRSVMVRALWLFAERGYLSMEWVPFLKVVAKAPTLVSRNKAEEASTNKTYNEMGVKSVETIQQELDLDPDVERERLGREAARKQQQQQPSAIDPDQAGGVFGAGLTPLAEASLIERLTESFRRIIEEGKSGIFTDSSGRKYKLEDGKHVPLNQGGEPSSARGDGSNSQPVEPIAPETVEHLRQEVGPHADNPGLWGRIKRAASTAHAIAFHLAIKAAETLGAAAPAVLDTPEDITNPLIYGVKDSAGSGSDPLSQATGLNPWLVAKIASVVVGQIAKRLAPRKESVRLVWESQVDPEVAADVLIEIHQAIAKALGYALEPADREGLINALRKRFASHEVEADGKGKSGVFTDKKGHKYKLADGKRVPIGTNGSEPKSARPLQSPSVAPKSKQQKPKRTPPPKLSAKAIAAKKAHVLVDSSIQRYAEETNEPAFAKAMGGVSFPNGEPIDVAIPDEEGKVSHGVELKTRVIAKGDRITMNRYAQIRKINWEREQGATFHTVVLDDREVFDFSGEGNHQTENRKMYYRRGVGSFVVEAMHPVESEEELKELMAMPDDQLPDAAKRTDQKNREGKWREISDSEGKGFKNSKTGEIVRPKK